MASVGNHQTQGEGLVSSTSNGARVPSCHSLPSPDGLSSQTKTGSKCPGALHKCLPLAFPGPQCWGWRVGALTAELSTPKMSSFSNSGVSTGRLVRTAQRREAEPWPLTFSWLECKPQMLEGQHVWGEAQSGCEALGYVRGWSLRSALPDGHALAVGRSPSSQESQLRPHPPERMWGNG